MKCPICRKDVNLNDPEMPFCSKRCRDADLGNWAMEAYRIPTREVAHPLADKEAAETDESEAE